MVISYVLLVVCRWNFTVLDLCCDDVTGFMADREGCSSGCQGFEPEVNILPSQSEKSLDDQCKFPPVHPKIQHPEQFQ